MTPLERLRSTLAALSLTAIDARLETLLEKDAVATGASALPEDL